MRVRIRQHLTGLMLAGIFLALNPLAIGDAPVALRVTEESTAPTPELLRTPLVPRIIPPASTAPIARAVTPLAPPLAVRAVSLTASPPQSPDLVTPGAGSSCNLLAAREAPTVCTHGPDPAPPGVDISRYVPTEELRAPGPLYAETAAHGGGSTDGTGQIVCDGDGSSGKRVEALYVVASDRKDRYSALTSHFSAWARNADAVFNRSAKLTGGARHLRFVTQSCALKVTKVIVSPAADDNIGNTIAAVQAKGFNRTDRRYLMWVDANVYCGIGTLEIDDQPGDANRNNGSTAAYSRVDNACWGYAEAHELMHNLGGVQPSAPNATRGAHCRDESDEMCYDDDGAGPTVMQKVCATSHAASFDCGKNDYFSTRPAAGSWLATHWNTANSDFLMNPLAPLDRTPPPVPTGLAATATETSVTIRWNASTASDIAGYRIFRNGTQLATSTTPAWTNSGLTPGVQYRYQVEAVDRSGNVSPRSAALTAGAVDRTPPSAPRDLRSEHPTGAPKLLWQPSPERDVARYDVMRDGHKVAQLPAAARSWADTNFGLAVHRSYQLHAVDHSGNVSEGSAKLLVLNTNPL